MTWGSYDGDGSTFGSELAGPAGSGTIERVLTDYSSGRGMVSEPIPFDGRSDYVGFINRGIPAGGVFAGAEAHKTAAQVAKYGGVEGVWGSKTRSCPGLLLCGPVVLVDQPAENGPASDSSVVRVDRGTSALWGSQVQGFAPGSLPSEMDTESHYGAGPSYFELKGDRLLSACPAVFGHAEYHNRCDRK